MLTAEARALVEENMEWARHVGWSVASKVGARGWAEDLTAAAFEGLCVKAGQWYGVPGEDKGSEAFRAFAYARVQGAAFDAFRTITHRGHLVLENVLDAPVLDGVTLLDTLAAPEPPEDIEALLVDLRADADRYLHTDRERQAVLLASAGMTRIEIARLWGLSEVRATQVLAKATKVIQAGRRATEAKGARLSAHPQRAGR